MSPTTEIPQATGRGCVWIIHNKSTNINPGIACILLFYYAKDMFFCMDISTVDPEADFMCLASAWLRLATAQMFFTTFLPTCQFLEATISGISIERFCCLGPGFVDLRIYVGFKKENDRKIPWKHCFGVQVDIGANSFVWKRK